MIKKVKLTDNTKNLINNKNIVYKKMKLNKTPENINNFKYLSNICRRAIINDKKVNLKNK